MVIGKGFPSEQPLNKGDNAASGNADEQGALSKLQSEALSSGRLQSKTAETAVTRPVQLAANDLQVGANGMPVSGDPIANMVGNRVAGHMHNYSKDASPYQNYEGANGGDHRRPVANASDMENGLWGPQSAANAANYNSLKQDFHTVDANFRSELKAHGMNGPQADQMRQFLYSSSDKNQRQQFLKAYNLTEPAGFEQFEQKYGAKANLALHWAMEQH